MSNGTDLLDAIETPTASTREEVPCQLRGQSMTIMVLKLFNAADPNLFSFLGSKIGQAPNFFRHAPVVLDVRDCPGSTINFSVLIPGLKKLGLLPVGIQGGAVDIQSAAANAGLGVFRVTSSQRENQSEISPNEREGRSKSSSEPASFESATLNNDSNVQRSPALVITEPVRSGRQVYAENADLIVLAPVSAGAELLADGNIHVYGTMRGRALAGLSGDEQARIFVQSLEAELISIAGLYRVAEDIEPTALGKAAQIYREGNALLICPLPNGQKD